MTFTTIGRASFRCITDKKGEAPHSIELFLDGQRIAHGMDYGAAVALCHKLKDTPVSNVNSVIGELSEYGVQPGVNNHV